MKIKAPRGTQDIIHPASKLWQLIEAEAINVFNNAGYQELRSPIFEDSQLFNRAVGADSDIVNKEMYSFSDRSDRSLTLRPEATASIVRAYLENNLGRGAKPQKFWYRGPMFRYERPQTGRYRQFHQIGIEAIGSKPPYIDLEIIKLGVDFLNNLGLKDLKLYINSVANESSRKKYRDALKDFLADLQDQVCDDCKRRYEQNPLRALDCKVPEDIELYKKAPIIYDYFDSESQEIWELTKAGLKDLQIDFEEDPRLVRGLDYYSHCVFEIKTSSDKLGAQSTVLAGGRYDGLVEMLGGSSTPAVGWALGVERLAELIDKNPNQENSAYIISDDLAAAQKLAFELRSDTENLRVEYDFESTKFKKQLEKALKREFTWAIFYLEEERNSGKYKAKNLVESKEHDSLTYKDLLELLNCKSEVVLK